MIERGANKAEAAMSKVFGTVLVLLAGLGVPTVEAGFRSPESLNGRAVTLNYIVVNGPDGWVISDVESPHDLLRLFLAQHRN